MMPLAQIVSSSSLLNPTSMTLSSDRNTASNNAQFCMMPILTRFPSIASYISAIDNMKFLESEAFTLFLSKRSLLDIRHRPELRLILRMSLNPVCSLEENLLFLKCNITDFEKKALLISGLSKPERITLQHPVISMFFLTGWCTTYLKSFPALYQYR